MNLRDLERRAGDLQATASPCRLAGIVVHGDKRGRGLGFPTANIFRNPDCRIPADGVYAGWLTRPGGRPMPALVSVGANITFDGTEHRIEAHAIDHVDLDLYGHRVELDLVHRLRDMRRCRDDEELVALMGHDVEQVRALLAETSTIPATTGNPHGG
ncbi:MAG: riboflavin kinase [Labedaea sp.]